MNRFCFPLLALFLVAMFINSGHQQERQTQETSFYQSLSEPYLGQKPPGMKPELFAPGIISTKDNEALYGIFNNGSLIFFDRTPVDLEEWSPDVYRMELVDSKWIGPERSPFRGEPWYRFYTTAPVGEQVYFAWRGSFGEVTPFAGLNIWHVRMTEKGWTEPRFLPPPVNSEYMDTFPSVAGNGAVYFFSSREGGFGGQDIYRAPLINGKHSTVENLGAPINTKYDDLDAFVAPDESYLIFSSNISGGYGGYDLYIAYKNSDGSWTQPVNMGEGINTSAYDWVPYVPHDGKYFFFNSTRSGNWDIYWVDAIIIESLRPRSIE